MKLERFSEKQLRLLGWWHPSSPFSHCDAVICDGAVRSGKTLCSALSFFLWAFSRFRDADFALCGKTVVSLRRNVLLPLLPILRDNGFQCGDRLSKNTVDISYRGASNRFTLFGGRDEGSAALIQGCTLAGALLDETALMPRSFVEQAIARCSLPGSRLWFNCNPEHPGHWFYREWIQKAEEKNALYLHFTMEDNPALSPAVRQRYETLYSGQFRDRFVRGLWVAAEGLVYPGFSPEKHLFSEPPGRLEAFRISVDYGTVNPTSMGLWGRSGGVWHRLREYYWDSRREGAMRTDEEHYAALEELAGGEAVECVIADPSAASFLECIRRHGRFCAVPARNDVLDGIRRVAAALDGGTLRFHSSCADSIREFSLYSWEASASGDRPRKEYDHAMDDIRYFVNSLPEGGEEFFAACVGRG